MLAANLIHDRPKQLDCNGFMDLKSTCSLSRKRGNRDIWATRINKTFKLNQLVLKYVGLFQYIYQELTQV